MRNNNSNKTLIRVVCCLVGTAIVATGGIIASTAIVRDRQRTHTEPTTISTVATESSSTTPTVIEQATTKPTETPTVKPTEKPTVKPTEKPTVKPTEKPTVKPTEKPTVEPTEKPTVEPTEKPTVEPTERPTEGPTERPTEGPTERPTEGPTEKPTEGPTEKPTEGPTEKPTEGPTVDPTTPGAIEITNCGIDLAKAERIAGFQFKVHEASNFCVYANSTKIKHVVKLSAIVNKTYVKTSDLSYAKSYKKSLDSKNYTKFNSKESPYANVMVNVTKNGKFSDAYFSDGDFAYSIHFDMPVDGDLLASELATIFVLN